MAAAPSDPEQAEKDLLARARDALERYCNTTRYRHLYPQGANVALLLTAYQDLQRLHRVGRVRWRSQRHKLRLLKARLKEQVRADALDRSRRLSYGFPSPKPSPILGDPPPVVWRALDDVAVDNPDTADEVRQFIAGRQVQELTADVSLASRSRVRPRLARGLAAFRDALVARSLGDPRSIPGLHPQYLALARSPLPLRKKRPIARLLLVKLPLYFWLSIIALLTTAYTGAYFFFNHENLGRFMTFAIGKAIDGELEFGSVSWKPSLIVDLVTGQPARVVCRDVKVWAPFKSLGHEKRMITAQADEIEVDIVLHEIIPWNIIGIPSVFEIPWVLHFTRAHSEGKVDVLVKQYADTDAEGNEVWLTSLTDAFKPGPTPRPQRNVRGLSFQMDALTLPINLDLDLRAKSTWQLELDMDVATFSLDFLGPHPLEPPPDEKPLRFRVEGHAEEGLLSILSLGEGGYFIPLYDFDLDDFTAGMDEAPLGDIRVRGAGFFAESPGALDGWLLDIFDPARAVDARLEVTDAGPLARTILDAHGMPDRTVDAEGALAELEFQGLMADPTITLATSGVRLNFFDDPALDWSVNDASVRAILHKERIPPRWADRQDPEAVTWLVDLDRFEGQALGGSLQIHQFGDRSHIVLPPGGGEILLAADLDLTDIDPGRLTASETLSPLLAGAATGRLQVPRLVLRTGIETRLARAELELESFDYIRERGPRDDGVPHRLRADGGVVYDELEGIDLTDLRLATDGASLDITGGIDAEFERLDPTRLHVRVSDGKTLWDSYGRAPFFDRLDLQMTLSGPVGAPDGRNGSLSISGVGTGEFAVTGIEDVDLRMDSGTIALKSRKVEMLGGAGPFAAQIKLFERGELSKDPKLQLSLDLEEAEIQRVVGDRVQGTADVHIELGDPDGNPVPLSKYQVRGALFSPQLIVGVTPFANVEAAFDITPEGLAIRRLELPYHRAISPYHAPGVTIPVGELSGEGSFSFDKDPVLDIKLAARELPVAALVGMAGVEDLPLAGQVSRKSALKLGGTLSKPDVEGDIHLAALSAGGIPLGAGALKLESRDVSASDGLAARREVRVSGNFRDPSGRGGPGKLAYKVRATVAIGETKKRGLGPISTAFAAEFDSLPLARLLHGKDALNERIVGGLEGLSVSAEFCDSAVLLLEECRAGHGQSAGMAGSTRLDVGLARFWMRSRTGGRGRKSSGTGPSSQAKKGPPRSAAEACDDTEALCSDPRTPLKAELDGTVVRLRDDWTLLSWDEGSSGLVPHRLTLAGEVDLSPAPPEIGELPDDVTSDVSTPICAPTPTSKAQDGGSVATLDGDLALGAFAGIARAYGLGKISGRVGVHDVALRGHLSAPVITGQIDIPADNPPIEVTLGGDTKLKLEIPALLLKIVDDTLYISGDAKLGGQKFWFGDLGNHQTFFMLGGDSCAGTFGVAARGELDGRLLQANLPKVFLRATGSFEIKDFFLEGQVKDEPRIDTLFGLIEPGPRGFLGELTFGGLDPIQISRGPIEVVRCSSRQRCPDDLQGYAAFIGGRAAARAGSAPTTALRAKIGTRGRATVWGYAVVNSDFSGLAASDLRLEFADVRFTSFDNSGRPQLKTVLSSDGVALQGREFMRLAGDIQVVSAKWIRDAQEQFKVLSFEDPTPAPESAPPPFLEQLQLDLNVRTSSPARVDNNVFKGVEGHLQLTVGGTYGDLDLAGKIDVNTGVLDINILGTPYDIQRGKVVLQEELSESTVDVLAVRQEPIYIDNQPRQMYLELGGTLDTIEWRCIVQGDATGALSSYECAQYLVLGGGEQEAAESTVKRYGGGGLLGKPINLFGNLTKVRLNRYIEDSAPGAAPYIPEVSLQLGQFGIVADVETPPRWFRSNWANLRLGAGYTRGYPGLLLRQSANWRVRFKLLDNLSLEFRDSSRSYYNERIIFDPLRQQKLELKFDLQLPSVR